MAFSNIIIPGFTGTAKTTGGKYIRFSTCSLNATQAAEAPDLVMGDYTKNAWAYGKIEVAGSFSGPLTTGSMAFIKEVWNAPTDITVRYYNGKVNNFTGCYGNTLTFNVSAGDVVNFTLDILGNGRLGPGDSGYSSTIDNYTQTEKILTWDKAAMRTSGVSTSDIIAWQGSFSSYIPGLQSFSLSLSHNVTRQFVISSSSLFGSLVRGMSTMSGQILQYTGAEDDPISSSIGKGANYWDAYNAYDYYPIEVSLGASDTLRGTVVFNRMTRELGVGPLINTVAFTGIGHFSGDNDFADAFKSIPS